MEDFKSIFNLFAALIGIVVLFFFKGKPDFVYTASGILWVSVVIEFLFRKKLPKSTISIRRPWAAKAFTAVMIIDIGTRIFEPGNIIVYNPVFLLALPFMVSKVLDRSEIIYIYDEGMVFDENCMEFSKMESVELKKEGISFELSLRYEDKDISMEIPPVKVDELVEALDNEGVLVMNTELLKE